MGVQTEAWRVGLVPPFLLVAPLNFMHQFQKALVEKWCVATVRDAVAIFHRARIHEDNEHVPLETLAARAANTAFAHVAETIVGDRNATAKRYGELCYSRFRREIEQVVTMPEEVEEMVC